MTFTTITVVLDEAEQDSIERAAEIRGVTVAEFVRRSACTFALMTLEPASQNLTEDRP